MKISENKKAKLKQLLKSISSDDEKQELQRLDVNKVKELVNFYEEEVAESEDNYQKLVESFSHYAKATHKHSEMVSQNFDKLVQSLAEKLEGLGGTITTSYEKNKPFNAAGVYKDMLNQLSAVNESIQKKPVPVWNWPQYSMMVSLSTLPWTSKQKPSVPARRVKT